MKQETPEERIKRIKEFAILHELGWSEAEIDWAIATSVDMFEAAAVQRFVQKTDRDAMIFLTRIRGIPV
jgi:hypothetical protein